MLKVLIVGCGKIAGRQSQLKSTHGGAYHANKNIEIAACFDIDLVKSKNFAKLYHCQAELNLLDALSKHKPDIVSVCTPDNTHFEITKDLLTNNHKPKVIFLEKPACQTTNELGQLINLSKECNTSIVVNHTRRFDQNHQQLRLEISQGKFGNLINADVTYYSGWQHNGIHIIDTLFFLFDDLIEIKKVTRKIESPYPNDPTLELTGVFKNSNAKINISSFDEKYYQIFEFDLRFAGARLRIEDFGERILLEEKYINEIGENVIKLVDNGLKDKEEIPIVQAISVIVRSIEQNNPSMLDGYLLQDVSQSMQMIWKGQEMAQQL